MFRESEHLRGGIRPNTVMPQDYRDYFVVQAAWERARAALIDSPNGHDSFLKDWDQLNGIVAPFVERIAREAPGAAGERSS